MGECRQQKKNNSSLQFSCCGRVDEKKQSIQKETGERQRDKVMMGVVRVCVCGVCASVFDVWYIKSSI